MSIRTRLERLEQAIPHNQQGASPFAPRDLMADINATHELRVGYMTGYLTGRYGLEEIPAEWREDVQQLARDLLKKFPKLLNNPKLPAELREWFRQQDEADRTSG